MCLQTILVPKPPDDGTCESPCVEKSIRMCLIGMKIIMSPLPTSWPCFPFLAMWISTQTVFGTAATFALMSARNYATHLSEPCAYIDVLGICGGGCAADEDNDDVCDDIDSRIGIEDECGVCNGSGPTEVVIEDIVIAYDSVREQSTSGLSLRLR